MVISVISEMIRNGTNCIVHLEIAVDTYHHMAPGWSEVMASEAEAMVH
jgi:hypothetical protein